MNSNKDDLPEGWVLCDSKSIPGKKYYFNRKTGKASWTQPQDESSTKPRQENTKTPCKSSKNDSRKTSLKRKSDCTDEGSSIKKNKCETITPEKHSSTLRKKVTPSKSRNATPIGSSSKQTTPKNLANTRLSQLREKLNAEAKVENAKLQNPKTTCQAPSTETPSKVAKVDLKSPGLNDSKSSIASVQSPTTDSLQSSPSPSQFLAANKIISSMKSQLQEEYTEKLKPKDTFADIEQGICNQSAEYSYAKHPSTPPQFTEANKLVSAIKSKLTYKASSKDTTISTFSTAKDRMEALRRSLNNEGDKKDVKEVFLNKSLEIPKKCTYVAMEVEDCNVTTPTTTSKIPLPVNQVRQNLISGENVVLVVDTNIFIHELNVIKSVLNSHIKGYSEQPTLLIPWRVINELDRLKDNNNGNGAICKRAKSAMDYLYKSLPENNRIKGQSLRDSNSHIYPCEIPDDEILNCCLQQAERGKSVILLSNDKNLCNKATINQVKCLSLNELKPLLENKPQPSSGPDLFVRVKHYRDTMYQLLANILENEMQAKYKNLWQHVLFKPPPWSLVDVLQCLLKHWIAVFNEVFPRIEHLLTDLRNTLVSIEDKDANTLTQSEVANFKDLCLDVARKCQIIPEYLQLAKSTVDRLSRDCASEKAESERDGEMLVIDAFERIWTVFSSYCAKLSTKLGISHNIEDKLPGNDPLEVLHSKYSVFSNHINSLTLAIKGALSTENGCSTDEQISKLEEVFRESLNLLCVDPGGISRNNVQLFCTKCRNMLQEACLKFTQLSELLDVCKSHI